MTAPNELRIRPTLFGRASFWVFYVLPFLCAGLGVVVLAMAISAVTGSSTFALQAPLVLVPYALIVPFWILNCRLRLHQGRNSHALDDMPM
jgi:hypothetical protein